MRKLYNIAVLLIGSILFLICLFYIGLFVFAAIIAEIQQDDLYGWVWIYQATFFIPGLLISFYTIYDGFTNLFKPDRAIKTKALKNLSLPLLIICSIYIFFLYYTEFDFPFFYANPVFNYLTNFGYVL